jgi:adenine-specific DNA-methyltransferase
MVQIPEQCNDKSEALKAGYGNIAEISKERIRRAGKKIKEENATTAANLDIGFRVLKVDTSNAKDIYYTPDAISQEELALQVDHIKEDRMAEDLLFQVMLDWGVDLALPISKESIQGKDVYFIAACFDTQINEAFVKELAKREPLRVVFRDNSFESDSAKINVAEIFKLLSPNTDIKTL